MGIFADKDHKKIIELTVPLASTVIAIETPDNPRALPAEVLAAEVASHGVRTITARSLKDAIDTSFSLASPEDIIIAFGSLSYLGDLIELVNKKS